MKRYLVLLVLALNLIPRISNGEWAWQCGSIFAWYDEGYNDSGFHEDPSQHQYYELGDNLWGWDYNGDGVIDSWGYVDENGGIVAIGGGTGTGGGGGTGTGGGGGTGTGGGGGTGTGGGGGTGTGGGGGTGTGGGGGTGTGGGGGTGTGGGGGTGIGGGTSGGGNTSTGGSGGGTTGNGDETQPPSNPNNPPKENKELMDKNKYFPYIKGICDCLCSAKKIMDGYNVPYGSSDKVIQLLREVNGKMTYYGNPNENYKNAIDCIDRHLNAGRPIIVGVNHHVGLGYNGDLTTDHFVVITGRGYDSNKGQYYYTYIETGRSPGNTDDACDTNQNRLYYNPNTHNLQDPKAGAKNNVIYDVSQIRPNDGNYNGTVNSNKL